jgi:hypothetical protein
VGKGHFEPLGKDKKVRSASTGSYLSANLINTPVSTQDSVLVALRQTVDKVIYQDCLQTKGGGHMKVLTLGLCTRFVWPFRSSTTEEGVFGPNLRIGNTLANGEALRERQLAIGYEAQLHHPKSQRSYE